MSVARKQMKVTEIDPTITPSHPVPTVKLVLDAVTQSPDAAALTEITVASAAIPGEAYWHVGQGYVVTFERL